MKRLALFVLLTAGVTPAGAQLFEEPPPRVEVAPFMGWRFGYTTEISQFFQDSQGDVIRVFEDDEVSSGPLYGVDAVYNVWGPWSAVGSFAYGPGTNINVVQETEDEQLFFSTKNRSTMLIRAGAQFRLPEPDPIDDQRLHRPSAFLFAAPALIRVNPPELASTAPSYLDDATYQFALNLGLRATGDVPWWSDVGYMFVFEDYLTFWNDDALTTRQQRALDEQGFDFVTQVEQDNTHLFAVRVGLTWKIGELR